MSLYEDQNSTIQRSVVEIGSEQDIVVYSVHMFVPYESESYSNRAQAFSLLQDSVLADTDPVFILGDFNSTIFSPQLNNFSEQVKDVSTNVTRRFWPECSWVLTS